MSSLFAPDLTGAPPALVYAAGFDPLRDEAEAYAARLRAAGVDVRYRELDSLVHGFALMTRLSAAARKAVDEIVADVGQVLGGAPMSAQVGEAVAPARPRAPALAGHS